MTERQEKKPVLLVIDDSETFLKMLKTEDLTDYFEVSFILYQSGYKLENILSKVKQAQADYLLLDVNLGASGRSQEILRQATEQGYISPECSIRIITQEGGGTQQNADIISSFTKINIQTKNRLLFKPISARSLRAELCDESIFQPPPPFNKDFPLPFRVLARSGKVAFHDTLWPNMCAPAPDDFSDWLQQGAVPDQKKYAGSFPGDHGEINSGYRIASFPLEQEGENFLGQIALTNPLLEVSDDLQQTLKIIFVTMKHAGFYRGRYYQLTHLANHSKTEEFDTLMELLKVEPKSANLERTYSFPLTGELKKRFGIPIDIAKVNKDTLGKKLIFHIRELKEDHQANDKIVNNLNELLGIDKNKVESWLEIPVYVRDYENLTLEKPGYRMAGLLIFDQYNPNNDIGQIIDQESVKENRVQSLSQQLLSLLYLLNLTLKKEQDKTLRDYEYRMRQLDKKLTKTSDRKERYQLVFEELIKNSGANSGFMTIKIEEKLKVIAIGNDIPSCIEKYSFPLAAEHYLLCFAFKTNKDIVCQDYKKEKNYNDVLNSKEKKDDIHISDQDKDEFNRWFDDIQSAVALPVKVDDKTAIGAIALQYFSPYAVTARRLSRVCATLHRVRWVMQQALMEEEQQSWEKIVGHDIRSNLFTIQQYIDLLEMQHYELIADSDHYKQVKLYLQDALDQAENLLKIWKSDMGYSRQLFTPNIPLQYYLELCAIHLKKFNICCGIIPDWHDPVWSVQLNLNKEIFDRIIRNILHNSFKYGRKSVDRLSGEMNPVQVEITATQRDALWQLAITNPGQMSQEEYEARFQERPKFIKMRDGSHIGLSAVKFWADKINCGLELENIDRDKVRASLTCQIDNE